MLALSLGQPQRRVPDDRLDPADTKNAARQIQDNRTRTAGATATAHQRKAKRDGQRLQPPYPLYRVENILPHSATRGLLTKRCEQ
ncbi:uncharacterized protein TrAFT101_009918 [Trichoderma asperellum]|uniref:uncharacterized protein n=1 Tax=Trichoderma asperellum TaxID=101201 RepID=UPI00332E581A|nr:hypothetical protein TrAFT101_009918 [Trichoderma asperellum]